MTLTAVITVNKAILSVAGSLIKAKRKEKKVGKIE